MEKCWVKKEIKDLMIAGIDRNDLALLKFTRAETETLLNWHHSKEFEYLRQMYDVVETSEHGDSVYYWCWWDKDETALNRQLDQLAEEANQRNPENTQQQQRLSDFLKSLIIPNSLNTTIVVKFHNTEPTLTLLMSYSLECNPPPSPPPEIV